MDQSQVENTPIHTMPKRRWWLLIVIVAVAFGLAISAGPASADIITPREAAIDSAMYKYFRYFWHYPCIVNLDDKLSDHVFLVREDERCIHLLGCRAAPAKYFEVNINRCGVAVTRDEHRFANIPTDEVYAMASQKYQAELAGAAATDISAESEEFGARLEALRDSGDGSLLKFVWPADMADAGWIHENYVPVSSDVSSVDPLLSIDSVDSATVRTSLDGCVFHYRDGSSKQAPSCELEGAITFGEASAAVSKTFDYSLGLWSFALRNPRFVDVLPPLEAAVVRLIYGKDFDAVRRLYFFVTPFIGFVGIVLTIIFRRRRRPRPTE